MEDGTGGGLPTKGDDEFRPFVRRLPEFKFWHSATRAIVLSLVCSFFTMFDLPVFWPVLVIYWFILFFLTSKLQAFFLLLLMFANKRQCGDRFNIWSSTVMSHSLSARLDMVRNRYQQVDMHARDRAWWKSSIVTAFQFIMCTIIEQYVSFPGTFHILSL